MLIFGIIVVLMRVDLDGGLFVVVIGILKELLFVKWVNVILKMGLVFLVVLKVILKLFVKGWVIFLLIFSLIIGFFIIVVVIVFVLFNWLL